MPRFEKLLTTVKADVPADEVAHAAINQRLQAVVHHLDKAIGGSDEAEDIHQLRVWTRRAAAALQLFFPSLSKARRKRVEKLLRKLRHAAGDVRDCDVQLRKLDRQSAEVPKAAVKQLRKERAAARHGLKGLRHRLRKHQRLELAIKELLSSVAWPKRHSSRAAPDFGVYCRQQLRQLVTKFFKASQVDFNDDEQLHAVRIAAKRLRYLLELAPAAMPSRVHGQLYKQMNEVQDRFGAVHDQLAAVELLRELLCDVKKSSRRDKLTKLLGSEENELARQKASLARWWTPARQKRLKASWTTALKA